MVDYNVVVFNAEIDSCMRGTVVEFSLYIPEVRGSNPRRATSLRKCKKSVTIEYHCDIL